MSNIYLDKISEAKILTKPFDHIIIDNFLEKNFFMRIHNNIDQIESLNIFTKSTGRFGLNIKDWNKYDYLKKLKENIFNEELRSELTNKFSKQISKKKPKSLDSKWNATLTFDNSNYKIEKHRDNNIKQVTFILYLKGGVSGTILHKNFITIFNIFDKKIEFKENRLLCFSSYLNTWHSVEKPKKPQKRFTIQAYLEFTSEPNIKWTSNGYPQIINKLKNKLIQRNINENKH